MIYLGIDPGLTGAIAAIIDGDIKLLDMPVMSNVKASAQGRKRQHINPYELAWTLADFNRNKSKVFLEYTQCGMKGAIANYSLGHSSGIIMGVLSAMGFSYEMVMPQEWKKEFGLLKSQKSASRTMSQQLFPSADLRLKKHEGRAEALLLAEWGRRKYARTID